LINYKDELLKAFYEICEKAKQEGYENGEANGIDKMNGMVKESYQSGLKDAWECARKIILSCGEGGYDAGTIEDIFGMSYHDVLKECKPNKAIELIKEYEEQQKQKCESCFTEKLAKEKWASAKDCKECKHFTDTDEVHGYTPCGSCNADLHNFESKQTDATDDGSIKVGDEVYLIDIDRPKVVTYVNNIFAVFCDFCDWGQSGTADVKDLHKTGRHFNAIDEILSELKNEKN
jgi:hypothetical protein